MTIEPRRTQEATVTDSDGGPSGSQPARSQSRRRFIGAVAATAPALAVVSGFGPFQSLLPTASAAEGDPISPQVAAASFLVSLEIAIQELYKTAITGGKLGPDLAQLARTYSSHHAAHALTMSTLISTGGGTVPSDPDSALVASFGPRIAQASDENAVIGALYEVEESMAATYFAAMSVFQSAAYSGAAAEIMPVDGQHAVVLSAAMNPASNAIRLPAVEAVPALQTETGRFVAVPAVAGNAEQSTTTTSGKPS